MLEFAIINFTYCNSSRCKKITLNFCYKKISLLRNLFTLARHFFKWIKLILRHNIFTEKMRTFLWHCKKINRIKIGECHVTAKNNLYNLLNRYYDANSFLILLVILYVRCKVIGVRQGRFKTINLCMKDVKAEIPLKNSCVWQYNILYWFSYKAWFYIKLSPAIYLRVMKSNENVVSKNERKRSQDHKLFLTIYSKNFFNYW